MPAWSGFWNHTYSGGYQPATTPIGSKNVYRQLAIALNGYSNRYRVNRIIRQLVNGNVGGTATGTRVRIAAQNPTDPTTSGGKRNVETVTVINRATTATDQTQINNALDFKYGYGASAFPRDKSGNGGGGKRGY